MKDIPRQFRPLLEEAIGEYASRVAFESFDSPSAPCIRLNPSKPVLPYFAGGSASVEWNDLARLLSSRPVFTLDPLLHAGAYYVQDSSSLIVGAAFRTLCKRFKPSSGRPLRILDLCAAPGGKTTDIASSAREIFADDFVLVSNEVIRKRSMILSDNVARWGDPNVLVTNLDPAVLGDRLENYFDVLVSDVPCSGEGMFRFDETSRQEWSPDNVNLCRARSARILSDAWKCLRKGGLLLFSTCTFNKGENDDAIRRLCDDLGAQVVCLSQEMPQYCWTDASIKEWRPSDRFRIFKTECGLEMIPGFVPGLGQYCAAVIKTSGDSDASFHFPKSSSRRPAFSADLSSYLKGDFEFALRADKYVATPYNIRYELAMLESRIPISVSGCAVGSLKGNDFIPDADLALCRSLEREAFCRVEVDKDTALAFLHLDPLHFEEAPQGFLLLEYNGLPLGFVKNLGRRCNSLMPPHRRILMNIK